MSKFHFRIPTGNVKLAKFIAVAQNQPLLRKASQSFISILQYTIHGRDVVYDFAMSHDVYRELQWQASEIIIIIHKVNCGCDVFSVFDIIKWPRSPSENLKSAKLTNYWADGPENRQRRSSKSISIIYCKQFGYLFAAHVTCISSKFPTSQDVANAEE